jgi:hypothetical protein
LEGCGKRKGPQSKRLPIGIGFRLPEDCQFIYGRIEKSVMGKRGHIIGGMRKGDAPRRNSTNSKGRQSFCSENGDKFVTPQNDDFAFSKENNCSANAAILPAAAVRR